MLRGSTVIKSKCRRRHIEVKTNSSVQKDELWDLKHELILVKSLLEYIILHLRLQGSTLLQ